MKNHVKTWMGIAVLVLACVPFSAALGQGRAPKPPEGPAPRLNGKPDLSGLWQRPYVPDMSVTTRNGDQVADPSLPDVKADPEQAAGRKGPPAPPRKELPFTPEGKRVWEAYDAAKGDYTGSCLPFGLIRSMNSPDPIQIMQSDKYLSLLYEQNTWFKVFPLDGRAHDANKVATWFGDSVGHWEGDTLVVDTVNFNGKTRLDTIGHPHSDQLHVVEHFQRKDLGHIAYEITINDPKYFTRPWKNTRIFTLRPDWEIMEYSCEENNKDFLEGHIKGGINPGK
ncbi:MAG: hypothetical protein LAP40_16595 [Acidobacteriia bacterium]|nr:hypothetical protein [Terriglobia bacterium]